MNSLAFINANVIPMEGYDRHRAILIQDGRIAALGTDDEIAALAGAAGVTPVDAQGATILPGFYDCHAHTTLTGFGALGIDLYDSGDIATVLEQLREADKTWEPGRWLFGKRLDEFRLREGRPPVMAELDAIPRPVFISDRGGHYVAVNRLAFDALGLDKSVRGVRLDGRGEPNGRLQDDANKLARSRFPWTDEQKVEAVRWSAGLAASKGITTIHAMEGMNAEDKPLLPLILSALEQFPVDISVFWSSEDYHDLLDNGIDAWGGDILLDGSIGSRTAAFSEKYCDGDTAGYLNYTDEQVDRFVDDALKNDLLISFHCIGELAITQALNAMEKGLENNPEKRESARLRLDHFGFPTQRDIERAASLGVRVSSQPAFTYLRGGPGSVYRSRLGEERERGGYPHRRLLDAGICVGGGSDSDITPMDSLLGIHSAVNPPYPENAVTPYEAVRMYTIDGARCGFEEDRKGSLKVGKQADLVVLAEDPMTVDPTAIKDIRILMTIRRGTVIFEAGK